MDEDGGVVGFGVATAGGLLIFIGLFLPLFTVHYSPPGGFAIVDGHRISAFTESISGWQFATTALWTNLLYVLGIFFLPIAGVILAAMDLEGAQFAVKPVVALFHIVVGVGWLLLLGLGLIEDSLVMPAAGEKEILPSFHQDPFSSGYASTLRSLGLNNPPTPHFSGSLGIGWFLVLIGVLVGVIGLWRWVAGVAVLLVFILVILRFADHSLFNSVSGYLLGVDDD